MNQPCSPSKCKFDMDNFKFTSTWRTLVQKLPQVIPLDGQVVLIVFSITVLCPVDKRPSNNKVSYVKCQLASDRESDFSAEHEVSSYKNTPRLRLEYK